MMPAKFPIAEPLVATSVTARGRQEYSFQGVTCAGLLRNGDARRKGKGRQACLEKLGEFPGDERFTEIVALGLIAAMALEEGHLFAGFHAFGDNLLVEAFGHGDHPADDGVVGSGGDVVHERLADFQIIDGKHFQIAEAGIARAEVIRSEAHSDGFEGTERGGGG